jgi:hypothetical protein
MSLLIDAIKNERRFLGLALLLPGAHKIFMKLSGLPEEWLAML